MGRPPARTIDQATTERLLVAAERHFGREGFAAARLEDIAGDAGISRPSLLYHFKTKDDLYAAVVDRAFARLGEALGAAMVTGGEFPDRLDATIRRYLAFLDEQPQIAQIVLREFLSPSPAGRGLLMTQIRPLVDLIVRFIRVEGRGYVRPDLPLREAVLQVGMGSLVRSAAGDLRGPLWGEQTEDDAARAARILFLGGEVGR
ncbi:MAG: TetR/AcrR family transcriptional regulator [Candidatus Sericytochromatia bacterium]|nr:TetR/AcrR family transcriptional regulator [Candidatus Tanganyikabacteria bacterium]